MSRSYYLEKKAIEFFPEGGSEEWRIKSNEISTTGAAVACNESVLLQVGYSLNVEPGTAAWFLF